MFSHISVSRSQVFCVRHSSSSVSHVEPDQPNSHSQWPLSALQYFVWPGTQRHLLWHSSPHLSGSHSKIDCRGFILTEMWTIKDRQWYIPSFVTRFRNKHLRKVLTYFIPYKNRKPIFMESKQIDEILYITVNCGWGMCFHYQFALTSNVHLIFTVSKDFQ